MIVTSKFPSVSIPDASLGKLILEKFDQHGDAVAVEDALSGKSYTFKQLSLFAKKVGSAMIKRGLQKGDVFGIHLPNVPEYPILVHGIPSVGGVITPLNPDYTEDELRHKLELSKAKYIITTPSKVEMIRRVSSKVEMEEIFVLGSAPGCTSLSTLLQDDGSARGFDVDPQNDLCYILYSSGTTGVPKGVMLTHRNLVAQAAMILQLKTPKTSKQDVVLVFLPFFGSYMLGYALRHSLALGDKLVCMQRFDGPLMLQYIEKFKVTSLAITPSEVVFMAKYSALEKYDLSSLKNISYGGAALKPEVLATLKKRLPEGIQTIEAFAMTEGVLGIQTPFIEKPGGFVLATNQELKVIDVKTGVMLGPGEEGEVCIRGPSVMKGYLNNPEATAATLDGEGWLHTGDLGHYDEDQTFFITGRLKEVIKYRAFQVPPAELEAVLLSHEMVVDAAVIGIPDEEAGELPKAFVVSRGDVTSTEIAEFVNRKVAPHKQLRGGVQFVKAIPKTLTGKILRRELAKIESRKADKN